jgi:hypothetical protein
LNRRLSVRSGGACLHFFNNNIVSQTTGANLKRNGSAVFFGFYLQKIGPPGAPGTIFGVAYLVTSNGVFSANITGTRHNILPF